MTYACAPIKSVLGFGLLFFALLACDTAFAVPQQDPPEVTPVESLDLSEGGVPIQQETPMASPNVPIEIDGAVQPELTPVESLNLNEGAVPTQQETPMASPAVPTAPIEIGEAVQSEVTPVESLDLNEGAVPTQQEIPMASPAVPTAPGELDETIQLLQEGDEGALQVPPPAALVTDPVGSADGSEKAELIDIVGDSIPRDAAGQVVGEDISLESTNAAIEKSKLAQTGDGAMASARQPFLSAKHIGWLWKLIWIALAIGFLLWLLSLMIFKARTAKKAVANSSSTGNPSKQKPATANALAAGSATANLSSAGSSSADTNVSDIGSVFARRPEAVDDLTKIGGIDAAAEKRLNEAGIWQYDQLRGMSAQQRTNLQRKLNLPRIRWYSLSGLSSPSVTTEAGLDASKKVRVDSENASATSVPSPKFRDDLTRLQGVDAKLAAELNKEGIYNFKQLESMSPAQKLDFKKRFGLNSEKLNLNQLSSTSDYQAGQGGSGSAASSGSSTGSGSTTSSPSAATLGLGAAAAAGIAGFAGRSGQSNGSASTSGHQESGGSTAGRSSSSSASSGSASSSNAQSASSGTPTNKLQSSVTVAGSGTKSSSVPRNNNEPTGFVYTSKPSDADDLSKLDGIDAAAAKRLNDEGIYKFEQLNHLNNKQKATVSERCQLGNFKFANCFPKVGRSDASMGFVYTEAPRDADDLTRLAGIDAAAAKRLNAAGIYKFDQLENLSDKQLGELATRFDLPEADPSDWNRCFYAWGRGINTSAEVDQTFENGLLNGVELPQVAQGVFDGEKLSVQDEQVIFRGSNPEGWGTGNTGVEGVETSLNCDDIRSDINFLRIRRADTQESVVLPMTKGQIFSNGDPATSGWNGSSEVFFGGRHVGAFAEHLPQEVETKFSQGGWGFGHRYDHNDRQEWGWGGRVIEPTTMEVSVGCLGKTPGTLVFRGSDPSIWNTQSSGEQGFAIPVNSVDHPINFVRIVRQATGEAVIVRVDGNHLLDEGFDPRCGWNGSSAEFSGGIHLGAYHCDLAQDFETRFEFGGWGFGHPYNDNDRQAWGWAGRQLPETTFEISLLQSVPGYMQQEVIS